MNDRMVSAGVMLCLFMVTLTRGRNITEEICRSEKYDGGRLKCSEGYCRSLLTGRTTPNEAFNSNCEQSCPRCFQAIQDLLASKKLQTETPVHEPTTPPVTDPTTYQLPTATPTDQIADLKNASRGNSEGTSDWPATKAIISAIAVAVTVGIAIFLTIWLRNKKRRGGAWTKCFTNQSSTDQHYTSVKMDEKEANLKASPEIPGGTVQPPVTCSEATSDAATHIQNGTTSNGCAKPKCTSVVIDERRIEAAYGDQQRAASDMATHIAQNGLIPNGTASRIEPALHSVQNANASETNATPQMGAMPQSSTQKAAPNETGPQVGNIPQVPPNRAGASPPNDVPRMEANPQVVTNSNPTGGSTTQQSTGAGGQNQSTIININLPPLQPEPAPTTNVKPKENLRFPVQEKGKGAEPKTTKEARDEEGGPHKFSPPD